MGNSLATEQRGSLLRCDQLNAPNGFRFRVAPFPAVLG